MYGRSRTAWFLMSLYSASAERAGCAECSAACRPVDAVGERQREHQRVPDPAVAEPAHGAKDSRTVDERLERFR